MNPRPANHLHPTACYICGSGEHPDQTANGGHKFWSNADARAAFAAEDAKRTHRYSNGETTPEGNYVEQTRGR